MTSINFQSLLLFSAFLRLFLIIYGEWQDTHMEVRYTDIDYLVFSDAAALVASGISPYKRLTYRYSPLIAYLLVPNSIIHRSWGKFIFSFSDILVGLFIQKILKLRGVPKNLCIYSVVIWLFNPFTFTIGTRGNCEPIVCAMILWIIVCVMNGKLLQAAFWYGLVVHLRIYPIIYALPIILNLDPWNFRSGKKPVLMEWSSSNIKSDKRETSKKISIPHEMWTFILSLFTRGRLMFGLISGSVFFFFTGISSIFMSGNSCMRHCYTILLTVAFVAFNKVITAQYFVWFFCLLPLIIPWSSMNLKWGMACTLLWVGAQTHWLMWGYLLEFKGKQVFIQLWAASLLFLAVNTFVLICTVINQTCCPVFKQSKVATLKNPMKRKL